VTDRPLLPAAGDVTAVAAGSAALRRVGAAIRNLFWLKAVGTTAFMWLFFVGFCMITWQLHRGGMVRAELFPAMVGVGYVVVMISRALATVLLYRMQGA